MKLHSNRILNRNNVNRYVNVLYNRTRGSTPLASRGSVCEEGSDGKIVSLKPTQDLNLNNKIA